MNAGEVITFFIAIIISCVAGYVIAHLGHQGSADYANMTLTGGANLMVVQQWDAYNYAGGLVTLAGILGSVAWLWVATNNRNGGV